MKVISSTQSSYEVINHINMTQGFELGKRFVSFVKESKKEIKAKGNIDDNKFVLGEIVIKLVKNELDCLIAQFKYNDSDDVFAGLDVTDNYINIFEFMSIVQK